MNYLLLHKLNILSITFNYRGMYFAEDMLSEEGENSCNSSQLSTKSEKNMADFEGEDVISDDELSRINAEAQAQHYTRRPSHMQQHLANMASAYHKQETSKLPETTHRNSFRKWLSLLTRKLFVLKKKKRGIIDSVSLHFVDIIVRYV